MYIIIYTNRRPSLMVRMLCYGHGDTSSNLVDVIVTILDSIYDNVARTL